MCGLAGVLQNNQREGELSTFARRMSDALEHRGPDASGLWVDQDAGVALSHRRLAIMDLSIEGHQPMVSESGRYALVYNGEVYNHHTIRADLEAGGRGPKWRGHSDTETLLAAIEAWGLCPALQRCNGMFAIAIWDRQDKSLSLARDRMGEKPFYLAKTTNGWAFASELKPLHHAPGFKAMLDRGAIAAFLAYGYVPENHCIFQNVVKVPPGGILKISPNSETPELSRYYELSDDTACAANRDPGSELDDLDGAMRHIESMLRGVIDEQMISDVPLGCFLSGGVDSSLVAALMQGQTDSSVLTFSVGFKEARFNEAPHAAAVARHLKTDHTEFILSEDDALDVVRELPQIYDEPFADSSQIPTTLLCREARKAVTVALTGDGGDEVFGGYNRHVLGPKLLRRLQQVPAPLLRQGSRLAVAFGPALTRESGIARKVAMKMKLPVTALDKLIALAPALAETRDIEGLYRSFTHTFHDPNSVLKEPVQISNIPSLPDLDGAEWMMAMDSMTYLPGDILVKVDRAAMANSLETRAPFLDARVVREAWRLPLKMKIDADTGTGKSILKKILYQHVPEDVIDRPKQGFAIPVDRWLRGALRSWGEDLLEDTRLSQVAGLNQAALLDLWEQHQSKMSDFGTKLWHILILLSWVRAYESVITQPTSILSKK